VFLDQMGAAGSDARIQAACEYVLRHTQAASGGFAYWQGGRRDAAPPPSLTIHCLNGNLARALIGFGRLEDPRVRRAIDWQIRAISGAADTAYYRSGTTGPGFQCASNSGAACAWGAIKALLGLARIPAAQRSPQMNRAIAQGVDFLLSHDPALATYPTGQAATAISPLWFKLGFPLGYIADALQNLTVLCDVGYGRDPRLANTVAWLLSQQDAAGRWRNDAALSGKLWRDIDRQGQPSKWVTLRACVALKAVFG
jgi:hypothetical protein